MQLRQLGKTDLQVSPLGFGCATLGGEYGAVETDEATRAVHAAIDAGINFFDVAPYYGRTVAEERLGQALDGRRDKVVLSSKCCRDGHREFDFSGQRVTDSLEASLRRLRTDHLDLLIVHDVEFGDLRQVVDEALPAAHAAQVAGKVRYVGVSGLPVRHLRRVAERGAVDAILSYCNFNPLRHALATELAPLTTDRGIGLINASPLHMGLLTEEGPPDWHPAPQSVREAARAIVGACQRMGHRVTDVALRAAMDHEAIHTTLVGIRTVEQLEQNLEALEGTTPAELLADIDTIAAPVRDELWHEGLPDNR